MVPPRDTRDVTLGTTVDAALADVEQRLATDPQAWLDSHELLTGVHEFVGFVRVGPLRVQLRTIVGPIVTHPNHIGRRLRFEFRDSLVGNSVALIDGDLVPDAVDRFHTRLTFHGVWRPAGGLLGLAPVATPVMRTVLGALVGSIAARLGGGAHEGPSTGPPTAR